MNDELKWYQFNSVHAYEMNSYFTFPTHSVVLGVIELLIESQTSLF